MDNQLSLHGLFTFTCRDKDGRIKWQQRIPNAVTNAGLNHALDVVIAAGSPITAWHLGLIDESGFTSLNANDTMASHSGWNEYSSYDEATREAFTPSAVASQAVDNTATPAEFTFNAPATIRGIFLTSDNTKAGTSGTLWSTATFASAQAVVASDIISVTYTITAGA